MGHHTLATGNKQTVEQFLEYWLEEVYKEAIHLSTYVKYLALLDRYVFPAFKNIQLQKLTQQQVQALYSRKSKDGSHQRRYGAFTECSTRH